jgi:hypothetical protein
VRRQNVFKVLFFARAVEGSVFDFQGMYRTDRGIDEHMQNLLEYAKEYRTTNPTVTKINTRMGRYWAIAIGGEPHGVYRASDVECSKPWAWQMSQRDMELYDKLRELDWPITESLAAVTA